MTHVSTYTYVTFANPNMRCDKCGEPVASYRYQDYTNNPCRHLGVTSECPSWGPVDGCRCPDHPHKDRPLPPAKGDQP